MRNIKRFLSFVLVFALLMTSLSCLGGVFTVAASADDVSFTGLDGVTVTTLGNRGALKTESQLTAAHGNNWIYAASEAFEFAPGTTPDYNFENNIVPTDGLVQSGDYVFLKVYYGIHGQYNSADLYLGLASFAIFYSSDFFDTISVSAQTISRSAFNSGNTNLESYGGIMNYSNPIVNSGAMSYIKLTNASANTAKVRQNSGYISAELADVGLTTTQGAREGTLFYQNSIDTWVFGLLYQVKAGLDDGDVGGIYLPITATPESKSYFQVPGMNSSVGKKRYGNIMWETNTSALQGKNLYEFPGELDYDSFGATFMIGEPQQQVDPATCATGNETATGLDGVTRSTPGNFGALKTESQLTAAHGNNWIYAASEAFEFAPGTTPDYNFQSNIVPTDGYVMQDDYVFLKVYYSIHGQYNSADLYLGLASFAIFYSSDFFDTISVSAQTISRSAFNSGNTNLESYGGIMNYSNPIVNSGAMSYIKLTNASANTAKVRQNSGYISAELADVGLTTTQGAREGTLFYQNSIDTWVFGLLYQVKHDAQISDVGLIYLPITATPESKSYFQVPGMNSSVGKKRYGNIMWETNTSALQGKNLYEFPGEFDYDSFGAMFVCGNPPIGPQGDTYTVTFYDDDQTTVLGTVGNLASGASVALTDAPAVTAPTGKTFAGWVDAQGNAITFPISVTANTAVYASYTTNTYTLTINYGAPQNTTYTDTLEYGESYNVASPVVAGYTASQATVSGTMPADNVTVNVTYSANTYYAKFYNEDGTQLYGQTSAAFGYPVIAYSPDPQKEGATFQGWAATPGGTVLTDLGTMPIDGTNFYAVFSTGSFSITYYVDGVVYATQNYGFGDNVTLPTNPEKYGYDFASWTWSTGSQPATMPSANITATATFTPGTYNAVFYDADGEVFATVPTQFNAAIQAPATNPTKTGYEFDSWSPSVGTMNTEGKEFYPVFNAKTYPVIWDVDGAQTTTYVLFDSEITPPATDPTKPGHTFAGWSLNGTVVTFPMNLTTEGATFVATWSTGNASYTVNTYTMDTTGAYGTPATQTLSGATGSTVTASYTIDDGFYLDTQSVTSGTVAADGSLVLNVYIGRNTYAFTYTDEDGAHTSQVYYGATLTAPTAAHKYGHEFSAWNPAVTGTMTTAGFSTTAVYVPGTYTVEFVVDGNTVSTDSVAFGGTVNAPADPTKPGATFNGWKLDGTIVTFPTTLQTEGATYVADFTSNDYHIYVYGEDTTTPIYTFTGVTGDSFNEPTRPTWSDGGMSFTGWENANGETINWSSPVVIGTADIYIYAKWSPKSVYVIFWSLDDEWLGGGDAHYGDSVSDLADDFGADPGTVQGKAFVGWFEVDFNYDYIDLNTPATTVGYNEYIYYKPYFLDATYTVTFIGLDGTTTAGTQTGSSGDTITAPTITPAQGYHIEWVDGNGNAMPAEIAGDATYYATEVANIYQLTVTYVMADESDAPDDDVYDVAYGTQYSYAPASVPGYEPNVTTISGTMGAGDASVVVTLNPIEYELRIHYYYVNSTDDVFQTGDYVYNYPYNSLYNVPSPTKYGYQPSIASVSGRMDVVGGKTETVYYGTDDCLVDILYVLASDHSVVLGQAQPGGEFDTPYSVPSPSFTGYQLVDANDAIISGVFDVDTQIDQIPVIYVEYEPITVSITFNAGGGLFGNNESVITIDAPFGSAFPTVENPVWEGHTFTGWDTEIPDTVPAQNVVLNAVYDTQSFAVTITYIYENGDTAAETYTQNYNFGASYSVASPAIEGYTADPAVVEGTVAGAVNVTVTYTANTYNATFDLNGGNVNGSTEDVVVPTAYGSTPVAPVPVMAGYDFAGWDPAVSAQPAGDTTYTAQWTESGDTPYTVTVYTMGTDGTYDDGVVDNRTGVTGAPVNAASAVLEDGFYYDTAKQGYNAEGTIGADGLSAFTVYIGRYQYDLTFVVDGNETTSQVYYGAAITAPVPSKDGYDFTGWDINVPETMPAGNLTATAQFSPIAYTLTIKLVYEDNTSAGEDVVFTVPYMTTYNYTPAAITGYAASPATVSGVMDVIGGKTETVTYLANACSVTIVYQYADGTPIDTVVEPVAFGSSYSFASPTIEGYTAAPAVVDGVMEDANGITVTVTYTANTYTLSITYNYPDGAQTVNYDVVYGTEYNYASPAVEGYTADPAAVTGTMGAGNATATVNYNINSYKLTITYTMGDNSAAPTTAEYTYNYNETYSVATPAIDGYTPDVATVEGTMGAADATAQVIYTPNSYSLTINYKYANGDVAAPTYQADVRFNTAYSVASPAVEGYAPDVPVVYGTMNDVNGITVTVVYAIQSYDVIFDLNQGKIGDSTDNVVYHLEYNAVITAPTGVTREGYDFNGWSPEFVEGATVPAGGITYVAQWIQDTSYCHVKKVERITTPYYDVGLATYAITVEGTPSRIQIYFYDGEDVVIGWNYTRYQDTVTGTGDETGLVSIETIESGEYAGCELWTIYTSIPAGQYKARAKMTYENNSWEEFAYGCDFTNEYDIDPTPIEPVGPQILEFSVNKTEVKRGNNVTFTVKTTDTVEMLRLVGTVNGEPNGSFGVSKTSIGSGWVDKGNGTATWTFDLTMTYADMNQISELNTYNVFYYNDAEEWVDDGIAGVDILVTKYDTSIEVHEVDDQEVDPFSVLSVDAAPGKKLAFSDITIVTTSDVSKIRITVDGKAATYATDSTYVTYADNGNGTATWTVSYRYKTTGEKEILVEARAYSWDNCSSMTATTHIYNSLAELNANQGG